MTVDSAPSPRGDSCDRVALVCVRDKPRQELQVLLQVDVGADDGKAATVSLLEGRVEVHDRAAGVVERCHGRTGDDARRRLGHDMSPARALAFWTAGIRVLLAATGTLPAVRGPSRVPVRQTIPLRQRRCLEDMRDLAAFAVREDLRWDLGRLLFFSRWTARGAVTGTFLVHLPERVGAAGLAWQAPDSVLLGWRDRRLGLDFQTFACLRTLADFSSCDSLFSEYAAR